MSRRNDRNEKKDAPALVEKLICVNKVSKTVKGGKNFSFSALVIVGDKKGRVGYGKGKAREVVDARRKAFEAAKKVMVKVPLKEGRTIHHDVYGHSGSGKVFLRTAPSGTGIISGGPMRSVFECLGVQDIVTKSLGSSNPYNIVAATFDALQNIDSPKHVSDRLGKHVSEIIKKRNAVVGQVDAKKAETKEEEENYEEN